MPAIAGHLFRLSYGGPIFTTETWSNTLHFDSPGVDQPDTPAMIAALQKLNGLTQASSSISWWKYNELVPLTGKYLDPTSNTHDVNPALVGAQATVPAQLALCVTMGTAVTRGGAHGGRIYLPYAPVVAGDTGLIPVADQLVLRENSRLFLKALIATKTHRLVIWSHAKQTSNAVTRVSVGRVVDTQRRRRKSLKEGHNYAALG